MKTLRQILFASILTCVLLAVASSLQAQQMTPEPANKKGGSDPPSGAETKAIAEEGFIYGLPIVMNYAVMYAYAIDKGKPEFKAPFNQIKNEARVFTYKDTAIVTPNSDTPYSFAWLDLRAEPVVLCVPEVEKGRYYAVQLVDSYTFNYAYVGSRATGNDAGCYMVAGPDWHGETPAGIKAVFRCETQFSLAGYRTQLLGPDDMDNVKKVQAGYKEQTLSTFLGKPAPPPDRRSISRRSTRRWSGRVSLITWIFHSNSVRRCRRRGKSAPSSLASASGRARRSTSKTFPRRTRPQSFRL